VTFCTLEIADQLILRSEGGPPEAEYALVDASDIELRALELGAIREVGYRTSVGDARDRLTAAGITPAVVQEAESAARSAFGPFARGEAARRLLPVLTAAELFDGARYLCESRTYEGLVLDMPALSAFIKTGSASATLQAISLAAVLRDLPEGATVMLTTLPYMRDRRPGERSYRRVSFKDISQVIDALKTLDRALAYKDPDALSTVRTGRELLERLRERGLSADRMISIEQALTMATPPSHGPLSDPSAWAIELQLSTGELMGALDRIDALERQRGRQPVTIYLRSRASLLMGAETPRAIAERVANLCASHPFAEYSLLAAQAWLSAGELDMALPFARAVVLNSEASTAIRDRAEDILGAPSTSRTGPPNGMHIEGMDGMDELLREFAAAGTMSAKKTASSLRETLQSGTEAVNGGAGKRRISEQGLAPPLDRDWDDVPARPTSFVPAPTMKPSSKPPKPLPTEKEPPESVAPFTPAPPTAVLGSEYPTSKSSPAVSERASSVPPPASKSVPPPRASVPPPRPATTKSSAPPPSIKPSPGNSSVPPKAASSAPPKPMQPVPRPPPRAAATSRPPPPRPRQTSHYPSVIDVPGEVVRGPNSENLRALSRTQVMGSSGARVTSPSQPPPVISVAPVVTVGSIEPMAPMVIGNADSTVKMPSYPPPPPQEVNRASPTPANHPSRPSPAGFVPPSIPPGESPHGASLPAFVSDVPPAAQAIPPPPRLPRFDPGPPELAETLSLPPGLHGQIAAPGGELPRGVMEARIFFTHQSRELGREYRMRYGITLKTDVQAVEHMQTILRERLPDGAIRTREDAMLVRRHGAFLTEILARTLGAIWVDVAPSEIGYWAMLVPPGTRVWPFGRVLRLLLRGYRERDLVSYYLELKTRSRRA
jgi:hypothetical protein